MTKPFVGVVAMSVLQKLLNIRMINSIFDSIEILVNCCVNVKMLIINLDSQYLRAIHATIANFVVVEQHVWIVHTIFFRILRWR